MAELPPCGLYRTRRALGDVPAGRLVYFHNHGNPGAGIYLPSGWVQNRATFHQSGIPIAEATWVESLEPLRPEGFYRVEKKFECCEKKCVTYEPMSMVQLGYDGTGEPILFVPEWTKDGFRIPDRGNRVTLDRLESLMPLKVPGTAAGLDHVVH